MTDNNDDESTVSEDDDDIDDGDGSTGRRGFDGRVSLYSAKESRRIEF